MRNLLLTSSLFTLMACNSAEKTAIKSQQNEALIKEYFTYFNQHDWPKMASMYAETTEFKDPLLGKGIVRQSREQAIQKYNELNQAFPDLKDSIVNIYPTDDTHIIVEFVSTGTAHDKSTFELPICTIFKIENGVITQDFTYYDNFEE